MLAALILLPAGGGSALPLCVGPNRTHCVVDGDTFWLDREKFRIAGIDAPETDGACRQERRRAAAASARLAGLLDPERMKVIRRGTDRYGRTLADVLVDGRDVGRLLIREGHARPWPPKARWC